MRVFSLILILPLLINIFCSSREVETIFDPDNPNTPSQTNSNSNSINFRINLTSYIRELEHNRPTRIDLFEVVFTTQEISGLDAGDIRLDDLSFPKFENIDIGGITYRLMDKEENLLEYNETYNIHIQGKSIIPELIVKIKTPESPLRLFYPEYNNRISNKQKLKVLWKPLENFNDEKIELSITKKDEEICFKKSIPDNGEFILDLSESGFLPKGYYDFCLTRIYNKSLSKERDKIKGVFLVKLATETTVYLTEQ